LFVESPARRISGLKKPKQKSTQAQEYLARVFTEPTENGMHRLIKLLRSEFNLGK
jgi:hypothetical protein